MSDYTPAQLYAAIVGAVLVVAGIIGFFYNSTFTSDTAVHDDVFGILSVNGWHNVVHIATGALGLLAVGYAARFYAFGLGVVYIAVAIWGFVLTGSNPSILDVVPVNTADNFLHAALGVLGILAGLATPAEAEARVDRAAPAT
jgi:Domain of unknown function (DUF4383)